MVYSKILGSGSALPELKVSNDDLAKKLAQKGIETSDEWINSRTGISQRYIASDSETTSTLATKAAKLAMENAGVTADDIDLIVLGTSTPDHIFPSTACLIQANLGVENGAAFDVQAVCSGFLYALTVADKFIKSNASKMALVIGADTLTKILDWNDRRTCVLFGDGAGAVVLGASEEAGIIATQINSMGSLNGILNTPGNIRHGQIVGDPFLRMDGQAVFKQAVTKLEKSALEVCEMAGISTSEIDWFIPHQANARIISSLARKLDLPEERVIMTVSEHANTSAASVPLALDYAFKNGLIKSGHLAMLQGVGGGFTWGSVLVRF
ncbi:beta-ketoacyl-ACP synthase III [Taylorella equigenitalis]|uniref:beta-ketoacyl-ACP synthase III n=1 Tax=Taylorella equigenitalis TaxID=29575 RepID=UPI0004039157|nr:beta-ketoacyl-ACP synthase III [Taylorella equigenitalis]WDU53801.1 ketoacyl-ACP synthase III [Taylorella equigenitalis]